MAGYISTCSILDLPVLLPPRRLRILRVPFNVVLVPVVTVIRRGAADLIGITGARKCVRRRSRQEEDVEIPGLRPGTGIFLNPASS